MVLTGDCGVTRQPIRFTEAQARAAGLLPKPQRKPQAPTPPQERSQRPRRAEKAVTWYWGRKAAISHMFRRIDRNRQVSICGYETSAEVRVPEPGYPQCERCLRALEKEARGE